MKFELLHPADQIVKIMNRIYYRGMTTTSGGNLSILDENGDMWISPSGIDKGNLTRNDICCIKPDGTVIGQHKPSVEHPFHSSIYKKRPDLRAVLHAHPPALVAFSIVRRLPDVALMPGVRNVCEKLTLADYAVPGSELLGENISQKFENGYNIVVLENHGVCIGDKDLFSAFMVFETLEIAAHIELNANKLGMPKRLGDKQISVSATKHHINMDEFVPKLHSSEERAARAEMITLIRRSYNQGLFGSTQGTYSVKLSDGSYLITPFGMDRFYLEEADLVLIKNGMREQGKIPSRSVLFHKYVYEKYPDIGSVLLAHPPNVMAFAVTDTDFDPRTIPESYILLRNIQKVPYGAVHLQPQMVAELFSPSVPAIICENDSVIVTGKNLLNAFDRLEVSEATAFSLILSKSVGNVVHINDKEIEDINKAFNLN